jgi:hypothetical protein
LMTLSPRLDYSLKPKFQITFGLVSVDHVLTIFSGKIPANSRNTHELFSFFECIVSVRDVEIRQLGKSMGGRGKCRTSRSSSRKSLDQPQSLVHRHWCFQDEQARYVLQRSWKCSCTDTWRRQTKWFCRWIVVVVMCAHETLYVYSHECAKSSCFDENLAR